MMRVCHLDTCPVGVATQNPELRKRFTGRPEFVVTFFEFLAEQVPAVPGRAGLPLGRGGVGRVELLDTRTAVDHWKARGLDLSRMLALPELPEGTPRRAVRTQDHGSTSPWTRR
jgi:glutamate synthase (NADPH/NADH) large chain